MDKDLPPDRVDREIFQEADEVLGEALIADLDSTGWWEDDLPNKTSAIVDPGPAPKFVRRSSYLAKFNPAQSMGPDARAGT